MTYWLIGAMIFGLFGSEEADGTLDGYVEVDYIYVSSVENARISKILVTEGAMVEEGQVLVELDASTAEANVSAAQSALNEANANFKNATTNLNRVRSLVERRAVEQAQLDEASNAALAAGARVQSAEANLENAKTYLKNQRIEAPNAGRIDDIYYHKGEVATAGTALMTLLPEASYKAIFFVPEDQRARLQLGQIMAVTCDGCDDRTRAEITKIEDQPQFSPPIIYSQDARGRLVFRVEAMLDAFSTLTAGQPISIEAMND